MAIFLRDICALIVVGALFFSVVHLVSHMPIQ